MASRVDGRFRRCSARPIWSGLQTPSRRCSCHACLTAHLNLANTTSCGQTPNQHNGATLDFDGWLLLLLGILLLRIMGACWRAADGIWAQSSGAVVICQAQGHVLGKLGAGLQAPSPQMPISQPSLFKPAKPPCVAPSAQGDGTPTAAAAPQTHELMHMQAALQHQQSAQRVPPMVCIPLLIPLLASAPAWDHILLSSAELFG